MTAGFGDETWERQGQERSESPKSCVRSLVKSLQGPGKLAQIIKGKQKGAPAARPPHRRSPDQGGRAHASKNVPRRHGAESRGWSAACVRVPGRQRARAHPRGHRPSRARPSSLPPCLSRPALLGPPCESVRSLPPSPGVLRPLQRSPPSSLGAVVVRRPRRRWREPEGPAEAAAAAARWRTSCRRGPCCPCASPAAC